MPSLLQFATLCEGIGATTKKTMKRRLLEDFFCVQDTKTACIAAIFLCGRPFPAYEERTLQAGGNLLWRAISEITELDDQVMSQAYRRHGDFGSAAAEILQERP